jgi:hypothetical protein
MVRYSTPTLTTLNLGSNQIGAEGAKYLADVTLKNKNLELDW